jgi:hypothetical protein
MIAFFFEDLSEDFFICFSSSTIRLLSVVVFLSAKIFLKLPDQFFLADDSSAENRRFFCEAFLKFSSSGFRRQRFTR